MTQNDGRNPFRKNFPGKRRMSSRISFRKYSREITIRERSPREQSSRFFRLAPNEWRFFVSVISGAASKRNTRRRCAEEFIAQQLKQRRARDVGGALAVCNYYVRRIATVLCVQYANCNARNTQHKWVITSAEERLLCNGTTTRGRNDFENSEVSASYETSLFTENAVRARRRCH